MLSEVCGDMIEGKSVYTGEEIIVNEDNCGNNDNFLDNLFDADEDQMNREQEEDQESGDASNKNDKQDNISINQDSADGVKTGKKKKKEKKKSPDEEEVNSKELSDDKITGLSLQGTREDDQVADQEMKESTQLMAVNTGEKKKKKKTQSSDEEENNSEELSDDKIPGQSVHGTREDDQVADQEMTESTQLTKSQKKRLRKKEKRKREQEENKKSGVASNRSDEEDDTSIKEDSTDRVETVSKKKKKRKKQSIDGV